MILIDGLGHMVSTESEKELHQFARRIGLRKAWFLQPIKGSMRHAHYDLTTKYKINQALEAGAKQVLLREVSTKAWWAKEEK